MFGEWLVAKKMDKNNVRREKVKNPMVMNDFLLDGCGGNVLGSDSDGMGSVPTPTSTHSVGDDDTLCSSLTMVVMGNGRSSVSISSKFGTEKKKISHTKFIYLYIWKWKGKRRVGRREIERKKRIKTVRNSFEKGNEFVCVI